MIRLNRLLLLSVLVLLLSACEKETSPTADVIYINGDIVTMAKPEIVSALAIKDGRIQAIGTQIGVMRHKGDRTEIVDLDGKTMLPGFIDPHGALMANIEQLGSIQEAQLAFAKQGFTTLSEGSATKETVAVLQQAAKDELLTQDIIALPLYNAATLLLSSSPEIFGQYHNRLKFGGIKLILDGTVEKETAWFAMPYLTTQAQDPGWRGEPKKPFSQFKQRYSAAINQDLQVFVHAVGDAAIDALIQAAYDLKINASQDKRHVVIKSRFMRVNQLTHYVKLGFIPSFATGHIYFYGDNDALILGKQRAYFQSPALSANNLDIRFTNHTSSAAHGIHGLNSIWSAVSRLTKEGSIAGADERVDILDALKAITIYAAYQFFEEDNKGSLEPGKLADLVILSQNPVKLAPGLLRDVQIIETIKEGKTLFSQANTD
ncbi:amidohydrolase family protein [Photobacterium makurazakiensis]|uniref:amidohydrolase n=1 Tax=Photobacterium makurazakiensis TaxID=2910234 RepID=UPI003D138E40